MKKSNVNLSLKKRIYNFLIQIFLLPVSVFFQCLYGSSLVVIIIALLFEPTLLLAFFVGGPILWDVLWGFLGLSMIKKKIARLGRDFDDESYSYETEEIVEKNIQDTSGNIIATYEAKETVSHYGESDSMIAARFAFQFTILRRIISILAAFFAIFINTYAVSTKPIKGKKCNEYLYAYFDIQ